MAFPLPSPIDLIFPPKCPICTKLLPREELLCSDCARALSPTGGQAKQRIPFTEGCYSPLFYEHPLRESFLRYKFQGCTGYAKLYGKWMADCLTLQGEPPFALVTWAPLSRLRRWRRGYDQAQLLAQQVAKRLGLPLVPTLNKAYRPPLSRSKGDRAQRAAQVLGAYALRPSADVRGKRILLVDDVVTTGSTLSECARILLLSGAEQVVCLTLARRRAQT